MLPTFSSDQVANEVEKIDRTNKESKNFWGSYRFVFCHLSEPEEIYKL